MIINKIYLLNLLIIRWCCVRLTEGPPQSVVKKGLLYVALFYLTKANQGLMMELYSWNLAKFPGFLNILSTSPR